MTLTSRPWKSLLESHAYSSVLCWLLTSLSISKKKGICEPNYCLLNFNLITSEYFLNLRTSEIHLFYNLQLFYWHFLEFLWLFIFLVFYKLFSNKQEERKESRTAQPQGNRRRAHIDISFLFNLQILDFWENNSWSSI